MMEIIADGSGQTPDDLRKYLSSDFIKLNNAVLEGLPEDLVVNTHICRGNFQSAWLRQGSYDKVADTLFAKENINVGGRIIYNKGIYMACLNDLNFKSKVKLLLVILIFITSIKLVNSIPDIIKNEYISFNNILNI